MPSATVVIEWEWDHDTPAARATIEGALDYLMDGLITANVVDGSISTTFGVECDARGDSDG